MTYENYQALSRRIHAIAARVLSLKLERLKRECIEAGISPDGCCLHNAAMDDGLTGWCARNPARLKAAKRLNREWNDWSASRLAERIIARAFARVTFAR